MPQVLAHHLTFILVVFILKKNFKQLVAFGKVDG
jgi:hypothetical protein